MKLNDHVVCVDDKFEPWVHAIYTMLPKKGNIYKIRDIDIGVNVKTIESNPDSSLVFKGNQTITFLLHELINPDMPISGKECGFSSQRFAPLNYDENSEEIVDFVGNPNIIQMPTPVKTRELEIAA